MSVGKKVGDKVNKCNEEGKGGNERKVRAKKEEEII